jgi:hypothetical protein
MAEQLRAKETFTFDGVTYTLGQVVPADHPVAQDGRERLFEPVEGAEPPAKRQRRRP